MFVLTVVYLNLEVDLLSEAITSKVQYLLFSLCTIKAMASGKGYSGEGDKISKGLNAETFFYPGLDIPEYKNPSMVAGKKSENTDQDLAAVKDTCDYIKTVMSNFHACLDTMSPEASEQIKELNVHLGKMLIRDTPKPKPGELDKRNLELVSGKNIQARSQHAKVTSSESSSEDALPIRKKTGAYSKHSKNKMSHRKSQPSSKFLSLDTSFSSVVASSSPVASGCTESADSSSDTKSDNRQRSSRSQRSKSGNSHRGERASPLFGAHPVSTSGILQALRRLDNRVIPQPEKFDVSSGNSFEQFLISFETYSRETFRGDSSLWVGELGRFLVGEMLSAYEVLKVSGDSYRVLKKKLLRWNLDCKEAHDLMTRSRFTKAKKQSTESFRLYAARLEKAFRLSYPSRAVESSNTLRKKYIDTVPKFFQKQLRTARSIALTMGTVDMTWTSVLALASRQDAEAELSESTDGHGEQQVWSSRLVGERGSSGSRPSSKIVTSPLCHPSQDQIPNSGSGWNSYSGQRSQVYESSSNPHTEEKRGGPERQYLSGSSSLNEQRACFYCNQTGHLKRDCWRFLGLCLVCGSPDHQIGECSQRRSLSSSGPSRGSMPRPNQPRQLELFRDRELKQPGSSLQEAHHGPHANSAVPRRVSFANRDHQANSSGLADKSHTLQSGSYCQRDSPQVNTADSQQLNW